MEIIKHSKDSFLVRLPDPSILDDFIVMLDRLLLMGREMRRRTKHLDAAIAARDPGVRLAQTARFNAEARRAFNEYQTRRNNGSPTHSKALTSTARSLGLSRYDVEIFVSRGRRLEREDKQKSMRRDYSGGRSVAEIAALYGVTPKTVRRVLYEYH